MPHRSWKSTSFCLLFTWFAFFAQAAHAQVAVVTLKSIDQLISDARYLLTLAGQKDRADQLDGLIQSLTGGKSFAGVDTKRPLGVYAGVPANLSTPPPIVGFVPITKSEDLLGFLKQLNFEAAKEGDFYALKFSDLKLYLHFANQYLYVSNDPASLRGKLPAVEKLLPTMAANALITASVRADQIPAEFKQLFIHGMDRDLERGKAKQEDETEPAYKARQVVGKLARGVLVALVEQTRELTFSLEVDQKQHNLAIDIALVGKEGSKLSEHLHGYAGLQSKFSGLASDAAMSVLMHVPIPAELRTEYTKFFEQAFQEALAKENDSQARAWAERLFRAVGPTLKGEVIDFVIALRGPLTDQKFTGLAGLRVTEGKKLDTLLRDVIKAFPPPPDKGEIKMDLATHNGTAIHQLKFDSTHMKKDTQAIFGKGEILGCIRDDVILLTFGQDALKVMTEALDAIDKPPTTPSALIQFEAAISKLGFLAEKREDKVAAAIRKVFTSKNKDKDRIRLTLQGGSALRLRLDISAELVKLIAVLGPHASAD